MSSLREKLFLGAAGLTFVGATAIGVNLLFASADTAEDDSETCETQVIAAGEPVQSSMVTVNIFNASDAAGLANRVRINLEGKGFLGGRIGNSESEVPADNVTILTNGQDDPTVQLVAQQFNGDVQFAEPDITLDDGVTVILGPNYQDLRGDAPTEIPASQETTVCVPTIDLSEVDQG
ncbi:LytR family transcriptional regulator [Aeromicrobium camelliae]|uniref:LytR family transcriptional regulator n=1 Tax=Aeromicrobium camelliae TaxID=1538144 RepID=A0A3N6WNU1_9ACTN|nr:LytR C-terminal domain-containing protein [Aeromicrobium camelliae]RQN08960.1 LytR family transcriptional regulator [Aeromicrobium camelliae]